ncbi:MAG: ABC transporter ATP-binding protein [Ignavibacteria bacterium]|nr:ABC transporter ATP-binding protein [Ignavibacteria bacterium]
MIEVKNLTKKYNGTMVLDLPELQIKKGESFGLVGNNGAGKTTFFSLILDLIEATTGEILSSGVKTARSDHWKDYTGSFIDEKFLIEFLYPEEYFEFIADLHGLSKSEYDNFLNRFNDFFNTEILKQKKFIRDLSKGNQKKVGIAAALLAKPEVIILDEPFPHLDPTSVFRLKKMLQEFKNEFNTTLLISSHDLNHVTEVCERIVVLDKGKIVHDLARGEENLKLLQNYFAV